MPSLLFKIRRAETPTFVLIKRTIVTLLRTHLPVPGWSRPLLRAIYGCRWAACRIVRRLYVFFFAEPLLRAMCDQVGERLFLWTVPVIWGQACISIGDDVSIYGKIGITSGRTNDHPRLLIGNKVTIGDGVRFVVNQEVVIEDGAQIASDCSIRDSDGHPLDHRYRLAGFAPPQEEIKPVRICQNAWIGLGCTISKGVTIGEGAIIGCRSVVISDIPPYARALGNPARVLLKPGPPRDAFAPTVPHAAQARDEIVQHVESTASASPIQLQ
jgi:acetyltransferase-like isoleucine patch superfamily enzyme